MFANLYPDTVRFKGRKFEVNVPKIANDRVLVLKTSKKGDLGGRNPVNYRIKIFKFKAAIEWVKIQLL